MAPTMYGLPISGNLHAVWLLTKSYGLELDFEVCDIMSGGNKTPEFLKMNPMHCIPTLKDGDVEIWETNAILRYLCNKNKCEDAYPTDLKKRAECDVMLDFRNNEIVKHLGYKMLYPVAGFAGKVSQEEYDSAVKRFNEEMWPAMKKFITNSGGPCLGGAKANIADISIISYVALLREMRSECDVFGNKEFVAWYDAVKNATKWDEVYTPDTIGFWQSKKVDEPAAKRASIVGMDS